MRLKYPLLYEPGGKGMVWRVAQWVYSAGFTCLLPWIFFRMWFRSLKLPAYRRRWLERLGHVPLPPLDDVLWIHAVSVGEAISAIPLIHRIRAEHPTAAILITTTTPTGSDRVQAAFKDILGKQIYHCYLPFDLPWTWRSFFQRIKPKLLILMETELWPNLLNACHDKKLAVIIANGRLSPTSAKRYRWLGNFMQWMVRPIRGVAAQSAIDAQRFQDLGIAQEKVWEMGNIKFDLELPSYLQEAGTELRSELGKDRLVWIAASTHEGEEQLILDVYRQLKSTFPALLLLLVPRHPDRFNNVAHLCQEKGFQIVRRSLKQTTANTTDIFLGDTMGELLVFYAASDIAFVGGSFAMVGGHNLLEPAALGLPVLTGPQLFNFVAISEMLISAKGAKVVKTSEELCQALTVLFKNKTERLEQGARARKVVEQNRGALSRLVKLIGSFWSRPTSESFI